uniref:Uncharacterized protein n=1 Tax=Arundo donax TaxID=35708 RepID=A0A0A9FL59_ARUDO
MMVQLVEHVVDLVLVILFSMPYLSVYHVLYEFVA